MAGITEHAAIDGVGFCSEMNARGLLESLSIRAMVGCPPPVDKDQVLVWLKEGTMHGLRHMVIDRVGPLLNLAVGFAYFRLEPWVRHILKIVAIESGNPLFYPAFWAATDVIHSLPTMPLRNSAVHRILEEKPIEGVCLRLRSGPETVSRTAAEHLDAAMRSFRGVRVLIVEKLVFYATFAATAALLRFAAERTVWVPAAIRTNIGVELVSLITAGFTSYPFELLRNFMVVSELDEYDAVCRVSERPGGFFKLWTGFWMSVPRLLLRPLHGSMQYARELDFVRQWGLADGGATSGAYALARPGLDASTAVYRSMMDFGHSSCGVIVWNHSFAAPDLPASVCGILPLVGLVYTAFDAPWVDIVRGLSVEQYYTVFALGALLQGAWKFSMLIS